MDGRVPREAPQVAGEIGDLSFDTKRWFERNRWQEPRQEPPSAAAGASAAQGARLGCRYTPRAPGAQILHPENVSELGPRGAVTSVMCTGHTPFSQGDGCFLSPQASR